jgi:hypothetical protein
VATLVPGHRGRAARARRAASGSRLGSPPRRHPPPRFRATCPRDAKYRE